MKYVAILCMAVGLTFAADVKKPVAPKAKQEVTIPSGATKLDDTTYVFTDSKGKTWLYQKTPFGITRSEAKDQSAAASQPTATPFGKLKPNAPSVEISAVEEGDRIRFERPSPFGRQTWTKKKSELSDDEKAIWEKQKARQ